MQLQHIKNSILEIRGKKVILDYELAKMFKVETKRLKESVRRNSRRFPVDFMFELSDAEWQNLRCKFSTSSWGGPRYAPFAFTEQGIAMLSTSCWGGQIIENRLIENSMTKKFPPQRREFK
jgi:hypothetical protein